MTLYNVSTTDRSRHRRIEANTPGEALRRFVGRRLANAQLSHWTEDGNEAFYSLSVSIYDRPYRSGRDPVRSIHGHVWLDQAPACNSLNRTQKEHLRFLCADAMNSIDWGEELAEAQIPEAPELWEYLRAIERRISKALGEPSPTLY